MKKFITILSIFSLALPIRADHNGDEIINVQQVKRVAADGLNKEVVFKNPVFRTVQVPVQRYGQDPSCGTEGGQQVCETVYENECHTVSENVCNQVPRERCHTEWENECHTTPGRNECRQVPRNVCRTEYENVCHQEGGGQVCTWVPGRQECTSVPGEQICETVPGQNVCHRVCDPHGHNCHQECRQEPPRTVCHQGPPRQECHTTPGHNECHTEPSRTVCHQEPRQRCETEYENECTWIPGREECSSVPRNRCETVYENECHMVNREVCRSVPRQRCHTTPIVTKECWHTEYETRREFDHFDPDTIFKMEFSSDASLSGHQEELLEVTRTGNVKVLKSPFHYEIEIRGNVIIMKRSSLHENEDAFLTNLQRVGQKILLGVDSWKLSSEPANSQLVVKYIIEKKTIVGVWVKTLEKEKSFSAVPANFEIPLTSKEPRRITIRTRFVRPNGSVSEETVLADRRELN